VIGAVGVSGNTPEEDEEIAKEGAAPEEILGKEIHGGRRGGSRMETSLLFPTAFPLVQGGHADAYFKEL